MSAVKLSAMKLRGSHRHSTIVDVLDRLLSRGISDLVGRERNGGLWLLREGRAALSVDQVEYYPGGNWGGDWESVVRLVRSAGRVVLLPLSQSDVDDQDAPL